MYNGESNLWQVTEGFPQALLVLQESDQVWV